MPLLTLGNVDIHYEVYGDGEPLVLIPGFAAGAWIWFKDVAPLATRFKVVTFDPRGIGQSTFESEPLTMRSLADDTAALLNGLGIERAHILGVSFGGFVALEFALAYAEATRTLSLCCTSFGGPNHVAPSMDIVTAVLSTNGFNTEERIRRNLLPAFSPDFLSSHPDEVDEAIRLRLANPLVEEAYRYQLKAGLGFDAESRVGAIKAPTLVFSGDADRIVPVQNSRNLVERIPGARLRLVEGGSHLFFMEQPEEFSRTVIEFLTQN
ncbi:MAG TPA: alpha/beta fold hydrolase [Pyrinomonadaceae bacterium]|nr:alpha/beta fold hydrolase [Pyrinomonadaceae bacterium]